jgi:outer membrane autotransporter protein
MTQKILFLLLSFSLHAQLLVTGGENKNVERVLNNINTIPLTAGLSSIITPLATQPSGVINHALDQLHPAPFSALVETKTEINSQILSFFHRKPYIPCGGHDPRNHFWVEPYGDRLIEKRYGKQFGFSSDVWGVAAGIDRKIGQSGVIGIGGVYNRSDIDWYGDHGDAKVESAYGTVYLDGGADNFFISFSFMGGMDWNEVKRNVSFLSTHLTPKSNFNTVELMGQFSAAYLCGSPVALFYPFLNVDFFYMRSEAFHENGADGIDLRVHSNVNTGARIEEGVALQIQDTNPAETACISPFVSLSWVSMVPLHREKYNAEFVGESLSFQASGWKHTWQLLACQFGLRGDYKGFSLGVDYRFELSTGDKRTFFNQKGDVRMDLRW